MVKHPWGFNISKFVTVLVKPDEDVKG